MLLAELKATVSRSSVFRTHSPRQAGNVVLWSQKIYSNSLCSLLDNIHSNLLAFGHIGDQVCLQTDDSRESSIPSILRTIAVYFTSGGIPPSDASSAQINTALSLRCEIICHLISSVPCRAAARVPTPTLRVHPSFTVTVTDPDSDLVVISGSVHASLLAVISPQKIIGYSSSYPVSRSRKIQVMIPQQSNAKIQQLLLVCCLFGGRSA